MTQDEYFKTDEFRETLSLYQTALKNQEPLFLDATDLTDIAEYYYNAGKRSNALRAISDALYLYPNHVLPLSYKARIVFWEENNAGKALQILSQADDRTNPEYFMVKGELLLALGRDEEAGQCFMKYYETFDSFEQESAALDVLSLLVDYDVPEYFHQWVEKCGNLVDDDEYIRVRAALQFYSGDYGQAQKSYETLVEQDPFDARSWDKVAVSAHEQHNFQRALEAINFALAISPDDEQMLLHKAFTLMELQNYPGAEKILDNLYNSVDNPAALILPILLCKMEQDKVEEGKRLLQNTIEDIDLSNPHMAETIRSCADLMKEAGETEMENYLRQRLRETE